MTEKKEKTEDKSEQTTEEKIEDKLSPQLEAAATLIADLIRVCRRHGERGPSAVYEASKQFNEAQLRLLTTSLVSYVSIHNTAVAQMFFDGEADKPTLN
jgi:hypothetical protein